MGICPFIGAADFGLSGGILGPLWGSSAGAENRASRLCMLNEKKALSKVIGSRDPATAKMYTLGKDPVR